MGGRQSKQAPRHTSARLKYFDEAVKLTSMELHLAPETEAKLNELARRTHRGTDDLLQEAVENLVTYNAWFEREVKQSIEVAEQGEVVADEDVRAWLEQGRLQSLFRAMDETMSPRIFPCPPSNRSSSWGAAAPTGEQPLRPAGRNA